MGRLITVSIDCQNQAARQTFEEVVSRRRDYLVTKGQGTGAADMLLLGLDESRPQQTFGHIRELLSTSPNLEIFLTASRTDPQLLLEAFRVGVKEFLPQPLTRQDVDPALARFEERFKGRIIEAEDQAGKVICVIGARGGLGTSTVATNLATAVQQARQRESVALVDLDLHGGDLGLFLDLHPSQGVHHLLKDISRLDETIIRSSLVKHSSGVHFLASGSEGVHEMDLTAGSTMRVIGLLRSMHRQVVVDCGHVVEPAVKEALDCSDQIILVTTLSLPTIRRTRRLLAALGAARFRMDKVRLIVNRYTNDQKELLAETEKLLELRVAGLVPDDYRTASEALNQGKPFTIMAPRTTIGQWYTREIDHLIGYGAGKKSGATNESSNAAKSLFGRYLPSLGFEGKGKPTAV
jgi:pilus assembly protein CpaE